MNPEDEITENGSSNQGSSDSVLTGFDAIWTKLPHFSRYQMRITAMTPFLGRIHFYTTNLRIW